MPRDPTLTYQVMPPLSDDDFAALKADIARRGVLVPVEYDDEGNVLDGHHRIRACGELGIEGWPRLVRGGLTEAEKRQHARQLNLARRHLNQGQKRELIAAQLGETPEKSNRQIAAGLQVDHKTVGSIREELQSTGEIPQLDKTVGADGKTRPAKPIKTAFVAASPEEQAVTAVVEIQAARAADEYFREQRRAQKQPTQEGLKTAVKGAVDKAVSRPPPSTPAPQPPAGFYEATHIIGYAKGLAEEIEGHSPSFVAGGLRDYEIERAIALSEKLGAWLAEFQSILKGRKK